MSMLRARLTSLKTQPTFTCCDLVTVPVLPSCEEVEKRVPPRLGSNAGDLEKDLPQASGMGRLRGAPTPDQALPLDMDQAALDDRIRQSILRP